MRESFLTHALANQSDAHTTSSLHDLYRPSSRSRSTPTPHRREHHTPCPSKTSTHAPPSASSTSSRQTSSISPSLCQGPQNTTSCPKTKVAGAGAISLATMLEMRDLEQMTMRGGGSGGSRWCWRMRLTLDIRGKEGLLKST